MKGCATGLALSALFFARVVAQATDMLAKTGSFATVATWGVSAVIAAAAGALKLR